MTVPWHRAVLAPLALAAVVGVTGCADAWGPRDQIALAGAATAQADPTDPVRATGSAGAAGAAGPAGAASSTRAATTTGSDVFAAAAAAASLAGRTVGPTLPVGPGAGSSAPSGPAASSAPAPSNPSTTTTTTAVPVPAASCSASLPGGGTARIDLGAAALTCAEATTLLTAYVSAVDDGSHGNTKALLVSGWACQSPTAARGEATGVIAICSKDAQTLIARSA